MARDIEEFLRKAAERRRQQQAGKMPNPAPPAAQSRPKSRPQAKPAAPRRPTVRPAPIEVIEAIEAEVVDDNVPRLRGQTVDKHVSSHINTSNISKHAEGLGHRFDRTTEDADERMRKKFDRDISTLDSKPTVQDNTDSTIVGRVSAPMARDLVAMLQNRKTIRQAILISEILARPNFDD